MMPSDEKLTRIEDKVDRVLERVSAIDSTLAGQHEQLTHHIKRTDLLEQKIAPLEKHMAATHGALKLIGLLGIVAAIVEGLFSVLEYFKK